MATLAIDTSARFCAAGLYDAGTGRMVFRVEDDIGRGHAERLMDVIAHVMDRGGIGFDRLDAIAVTIGPGSFTGIRVGVAAARGFGLARDIAVLGTTTLESLAVQAVAAWPADGALLAAIGGGRGQIFCQPFDADAAPRAEPFVVADDETPLVVDADIATLVGDAAPAIAARLRGDRRVAIDRPVGDIASVASAAHRFRRPPVPLYLRGADAKPQTGFALPRSGTGAAP